MTVGLDTSVVVRLLVGEPVGQADAARRLLDEQPRGSCAVSDIVIGETYFALRHHYLVPHARAAGAITALLSDARFRATGVARQVLAQMPDRESGAGLMDRLIHGGYDQDGVAMVTFDRAAARLPGARRLGK
ncbi:MAG: PIN domain-containing protein [Gemmatimonadota bacterium]|nr:PIN domain-containing protein [Gemmatimonadota bacterium]